MDSLGTESVSIPLASPVSYLKYSSNNIVINILSNKHEFTFYFNTASNPSKYGS